MADEYGTGSKTGPKASKLQPSPARRQSTMTTEQLLCKPDISSNLRANQHLYESKLDLFGRSRVWDYRGKQYRSAQRMQSGLTAALSPKPQQPHFSTRTSTEREFNPLFFEQTYQRGVRNRNVMAKFLDSLLAINSWARLWTPFHILDLLWKVQQGDMLVPTLHLRWDPTDRCRVAMATLAGMGHSPGSSAMQPLHETSYKLSVDMYPPATTSMSLAMLDCLIAVKIVLSLERRVTSGHTEQLLTLEPAEVWKMPWQHGGCSVQDSGTHMYVIAQLRARCGHLHRGTCMREGKSYGNFPDTAKCIGMDVQTPPAAAISGAEVVTAPDTIRDWLARGVVTSCWKEESPTAGIPTAGRGRALPDPLLAPLESRGGGKEERNSCARAHLVNRIPVLKQTAAASTMGLRVGAGGLLWGHPARPHSGHSTGNREVPPCLMWGLQEEAGIREIPGGLNQMLNLVLHAVEAQKKLLLKVDNISQLPLEVSPRLTAELNNLELDEGGFALKCKSGSIDGKLQWGKAFQGITAWCACCQLFQSVYTFPTCKQVKEMPADMGQVDVGTMAIPTCLSSSKVSQTQQDARSCRAEYDLRLQRDVVEDAHSGMGTAEHLSVEEKEGVGKKVIKPHETLLHSVAAPKYALKVVTDCKQQWRAARHRLFTCLLRFPAQPLFELFCPKHDEGKEAVAEGEWVKSPSGSALLLTLQMGV
ncbi:hypothetical protein Anapl_08650 [Anas platyrhynchos]|uniref:Uncharacterized protein n=1 Tax=Anas platyrhynchos TaxID=8839 RepID=R0KZA0_ANAPL|nr:hypothetical protein Anapl_08650 [Anas platyrhynchos]